MLLDAGKMCDRTGMTKAPPKELRLQVIATDRLLEQIDELRRREPDLPSRSEMMRKLIERAHAQKPKASVKA